MPSNPYTTLAKRAFWRSGVATVDAAVADDIYTKKWPITPEMRVATAGSCFAQHIGRHLKQAGFKILDLEPAPSCLPVNLHARFGYGIYSARFGNIYTVRQLLQLSKEALGIIEQRNVLWANGDRWLDGLRPTIEPNGHTQERSVIEHRAWHLSRVKQMLSTMDLFIFTFGLTEAWVDNRSGTVFPICPGTVTDNFDENNHVFRNFTFNEIIQDFLELKELLNEFRGAGRPLRYLVTVSPVPLTATAAAKHVQVANVYSKSVLRSVAGELADQHEDVDYFPSYEIITSPWSDRRFYADNQRSVTAEGVAYVMKTFMACHADGTGVDIEPAKMPPARTRVVEEDEAMLVYCDEELLEAFNSEDPE